MSTAIRVRFAPSPTGRLHVGGARTALFNWLFARRHGGTLVLRIEDTDTARSTPAAEQALLEDLRWMGLDWDEGPDVGGPHAPYRQTERLSLYGERARTLLDAGAAFRCFCTDEELEAKRQMQLAASQEPHYDGTCRRLDRAEIARREGDGVPYAVRYHVLPGRVEFPDRVRGDMSFDAQAVGDFVLLRSNGMPTYNFACVVDDAAMRITHVIRGEDHLSNTLRQVMLYRALGIELPEFAHVSLIVDENRAKLKKRAGLAGTYIDEYRADGYLPDALCNFLALLGWSSASGDEVLGRDRLRAEFDLDRVSRSPAVFDVQKLRWMSGEHIRAAPLAALAELARPFLRAASLPDGEADATRFLAAFRDGIGCLAELPSRVAELIEPGAPEPEAAAALRTPEARRLLSLVDARWETRPPADGTAFKALLEECGKELGQKGRELFLPARVALSGRTHGPELPLLFDALGPSLVRARIRAAAAAEAG